MSACDGCGSRRVQGRRDREVTMIQVISALERHMEPGEGSLSPEPKRIEDAAVSWATYALRNLTGNRLRVALAISEALVAYSALDDRAN